MQTNIASSIQDYVKKINSKLSYFDCISLVITLGILILFLGYILIQERQGYQKLVYSQGPREESRELSHTEEVRPFASKNGKTYTFTWCSGSGNIALKNKIYFGSEYEAKNSGRSLSKLCQK